MSCAKAWLGSHCLLLLISVAFGRLTQGNHWYSVCQNVLLCSLSSFVVLRFVFKSLRHFEFKDGHKEIEN